VKLRQSIFVAVLLVSSLAAVAEGPLLTPMPDQPAAPGFVLSAPDGSRHSLEDMRGKPVIVNFWATWCPPCRAEMPSMQRAWEQVKDDGILMVAVNVGEDAATISQFTSEVPVDFPLPMDLDSKVAQQWPMRGLPTTFVVDPEGRLVYKAQGERDWDDPALLDLVRALRQ
jgi:thiol-disulfide isomerase/thioredoxin